MYISVYRCIYFIYKYIEGKKVSAEKASRDVKYSKELYRIYVYIYIFYLCIYVYVYGIREN